MTHDSLLLCVGTKLLGAQYMYDGRSTYISTSSCVCWCIAYRYRVVELVGVTAKQGAADGKDKVLAHFAAESLIHRPGSPVFL